MTEKKKYTRGFWGTLIIVLAVLAVSTFLFARCDIKHMKWKSAENINSPIVPPVAPVNPKATVSPEPSYDPTGKHVSQEPVVQDGVIVDDGTIDNRASDPDVLDSDPDIKIGDEGVEGKSGIQSLSALRKLYPDKVITGTYPVNDVIAYGARYFGRAYQYGSDRNTDSSFDCSDFTHWIWWKGGGMDIPKDSRSQWTYVNQFGKRKYYNIHEAQRGDLLFFMSYRGTKPANYAGVNKSTATITHVGIYLGDGRILHTASAATGGVRIDSVFGKHYEYRFLRGGSVL